MTTTTLRSGVSVMVSQAKTSYVYGSPAQLALLGPAPTAYALVQLGLPKDLHKGAVVTSARLRLWGVGALTGTTTLSAQRISAKWTASKATWSNRPGVTGPVATVALTAPAAGALWDFDVTAHVQSIVDGQPNYGWRISTDRTTTQRVWGFRASTLKPVLVVTYGYPPPTPTSLNPSAAAVSLAKPVLSYVSSTDTVAHQVQVDPAGNAAAPAYDSGEVATDTESYDLAATTYAGLADGASTQWRVRVRSSNGQLSAWSAWASFSRHVKPAMVANQPPATVYDPSPPVAITMANLRRMQVLAYRAGVQVFDSGVFATTTGDYTPPSSVFTDPTAAYTLRVRAWDNVVRDETVGDPAYVQVDQALTYAQDNTIAGVDTMAAVQAKPAPWVDLTWSRAAAPDGWVVLRNGTEVYRTTDYTDVRVGSTNNYAWRDWSVAPNRPTTYKVVPIVNGKTGQQGPSVTLTPVGAGFWLADPDTGLDAVLWGNDEGSWAYGEDSTIFNPIGADAPVLVVSSQRGLEGDWSGEAVEVPGYPTVATVEANLFALKGNPAKVLRMVAGDINIPVQLHAMTLAPHPLSKDGSRYIAVTFSFTQVGELPYAAVL